MIDPPTDAEWSEWTACGEARTCRDCGARGHTDGMLVADPHATPVTYLCEGCAGGYRPCDSCDTATDLERIVSMCGMSLCEMCAAEQGRESGHYDATAAWHDRVR